MDLMQKPPLDPDVDDSAPDDTTLTIYDEEHIITYMRLLDADAAGADWRKVEPHDLARLSDPATPSARLAS